MLKCTQCTRVLKMRAHNDGSIVLFIIGWQLVADGGGCVQVLHQLVDCQV